MLDSRQLEQFHREGFLRIKAVFSKEEIAKLRAAAATIRPGLTETKHLYDLPGFEDFWADTRLADIARSLLGAPLLYFFDGHILRYDFSKGEAHAVRHLHHDAKGTAENIFNRVNEPLTETYPALRFAIYFQDTENQSGGLKIDVGSHRDDVSTFDNRVPRLFNVESTPGDVIVFTHRLLHSPLALRLKSDPRRVLTPAEEDAFFAEDPDSFLPVPQIRETMFIDYASMAEEADLYIKNRAVSSEAETDRLAAFLVDDGYLDRNANSEFLFRVDRAIVESVLIAMRNAPNGKLNEVGAKAIARLPRLCASHFETSDQHVLHDADVPDHSIATAVRLLNEIAPRVTQLLKHRSRRRRDPHMGPTPTGIARHRAYKEQRQQSVSHLPLDFTPVKERAYDLSRWGDFHQRRKLHAPAAKILHAESKIFAMGSCFAMQIRRAMSARGLEVYPDYASVSYDRNSEVFDKIPERESLQHYDTFSMRQEFEAALGLWPDRETGYWAVQNAPVNKMLHTPEAFQDPYRKLVYATTKPALVNLAQRITDCIRVGIEASDIIVLTLGLTEVWQHKTTGKYLCRPPNTGYGGGQGLAKFRQSTFTENYQNMRAVLDLIFARYPQKHVVISVSPVALEATYSGYDVGTANNESKAILRAVAGQICREYANVTYFPSYEMATIAGMEVWDTDGRHVLQSFADKVVESFVALTSM